MLWDCVHIQRVTFTDVLGKYLADVKGLQACAGVGSRKEVYRLNAPEDGVEQGSR